MKKFEQMKKLYTTLKGYIDPFNRSEVFISGTTADFDCLFELSWKTLKEYLHDVQGFSEAQSGSPKKMISLAYREGLIDDEELWLEMLRYRNDDAHHYSKSDAMIYISRIANAYLPEIAQLIKTLKEVIPEEDISNIEIPDSLLNYCERQKLDLASFIWDIEKQYGYENANDVFVNWEKILSDKER